jgi:UDP-N-acetylmuramate dehydrogenase
MPSPSSIGNVGCFFKSPILAKDEAVRVGSISEQITIYPHNDTMCKVSAGDLVRLAGWAGRRIGNVSIHEKRPLIIQNHGHATGAEILDFANQVRTDVCKKFGVEIEPEVVIVTS